MGKGFKSLSFFSLLLLVISSMFFATEARPFIGLAESLISFDGLSLGGMKNSGPSPGEGHKFTNLQTLGGIKESGPSPGQGHKVHHYSFEGLPDVYNTSMGKGFKSLSCFFLLLLLSSMFFATEARPFIGLAELLSSDNGGIEGFYDGLSLRGMKNSGPSPGEGHKFTNVQTIGGIKDTGPSPGEGHNVHP
ncbi:hypothetical protein HHK36_008343 [Tetracentron sinense]|uniref:Transmembrane protein n=1 Tax=Tetracentron sinense TaxID=13715 RepID=A0A835DJU8_TETSI|nr:hypothetical protein HHK36_008343 [Tetracentron sinense]